MAPTPSPSHNPRLFAFFNNEALIVDTYLPLAKTLGFVVVEDRECTTVHGYWNAKTGQMQLINSNFPLTRKRSLIVTQSSMTHQYLVRKWIMKIGKVVWLAKLSCDPNDIEGVFMPKSYLVRLFPITSNVSRRDPRFRVLDEYDAIWRGRKGLSKSNSNWRSHVFKYGGERLRLAMLPHFPPANPTVREREDLWATVFDISHVTQLLSLIGTAVDLERIMSDDEHVNTREWIFHLYCFCMRGQWRYHHVLKSEQELKRQRKENIYKRGLDEAETHKAFKRLHYERHRKEADQWERIAKDWTFKWIKQRDLTNHGNARSKPRPENIPVLQKFGMGCRMTYKEKLKGNEQLIKATYSESEYSTDTAGWTAEQLAKRQKAKQCKEKAKQAKELEKQKGAQAARAKKLEEK
jgi:hypothetical protein